MAPPLPADAVEAFLLFNKGVQLARVDADRKQLISAMKLSNKWFDAMASEEEKLELVLAPASLASSGLAPSCLRVRFQSCPHLTEVR